MIPRPVRQNHPSLDLSRLLVRAGKTQALALGKLTSPVPSIWAMELSNEAYSAPRGSFWFISSGMGR